jgi:hypothetical protein
MSGFWITVLSVFLGVLLALLVAPILRHAF